MTADDLLTFVWDGLTAARRNDVTLGRGFALNLSKPFWFAKIQNARKMNKLRHAA